MKNLIKKIAPLFFLPLLFGCIDQNVRYDACKEVKVVVDGKNGKPFSVVSLYRTDYDNGNSDGILLKEPSCKEFSKISVIGDIDGDGHSDLMTVYPNKIVYFKNMGIGDLKQEQIIDTSENKDNKTIKLKDINSDGRLDIIYENALDLNVYWNYTDGFHKEHFRKIFGEVGIERTD